MKKELYIRRVSLIIVFLLISTTLLTLTAVTVTAATSGDFTYELINGDTEVEIIGYTGAGGAVEIPSDITGLPVTSIRYQAFLGKTSITSMTVPDSVENIGYGAFRSCINLASIDLSNNITAIANDTFYTCGSLTSVIIPDNVTIIHDYAFAYCRKLTSVTVPDKVTSIGNSSFFYCDMLVSIDLPDSLRTIGSLAFHTCKSLVSVTIPENVTVINSFTFYSCISLTSVTMPENLTSIGTSAFSTCTSLTSVTIPGNVTTIGNQVFRLCGSLTSLAIPSSVTSIGVMVFYQCFNLTSIDVDPSNPNYASVGGVLYNKALTYLVQYPLAIAGPFTVPNNVTTIGYQAFYYCTSLTSVTIPSSVDLIMNYGLSNCTVMTEMIFLGGAPTCQSDWIIDHNSSLMIYYLNGSSGFTTPIWEGLNTTCLSAPGSPQNLQATAGHTEVVLTWEASSFTGNSTVTDFNVYRSTDASGPFVLIDSTVELNHTDSGLTNGQIYWYNITAVNSIGESLPSDTVSATPNPYPDSPELVSAIAGYMSATLNWTAPANNGSGPITGYGLYYGTEMDSATWTLFDTVDDLVLSETVTGLVGGTEYYFGIKAVNADGSSVMSNHLTALPYSVPGAPTGLIAVPGDTNITLSWEAPANDGGLDIDHYIVYQDGVDVQHVNGTSTVITGLTNGQTYSFKISAHNAEGYGQNSSEVNSTLMTVPGSPTLVSATASGLDVILTWTAPASDGFSPITGYYVFYGTSDVTTQFGNVISAGTLTANVTGLTVGTQYFFAVMAVNAVGNSSLSNMLNATLITVPGAPSALSNVTTEVQVTLSWTAPASDGFSPITGYLVYRGISADDLTLIGNSTVLTFVDTMVTSGSTYYYKVSAVNAEGEGALSTAASIDVPWPALVPVTGKIVDADGNGIPGVTVTLEDDSSAETDASGNFIIMTSQGVHTLTVSGDSIETRDIPINVGGPGLEMDDITTTAIDDNGGGNDLMLILLVIIVVAALLVVVVFFLRKKK